MTNQEILNTLSMLEAALFYRYDGHDDREGISFDDTKDAWKAVRNACETWYNITGLAITD